jgi:flavodoxin
MFKMKKMKTFVWTFIVVLLFFVACGSSKKSLKTDSVSGATVINSITEIPDIKPDNMTTKAIIFLYSFHHGNTRKIANAIAPEINAPILNVNEINMESIDFSTLQEYELIGFGSGINSDKHYQLLLDFAEKLPPVENKKAFIFSTSGVYNEKQMEINHTTLRNILKNKGFVIIGEFGCRGYNTNSFLKYFGGMNKGRPNEEDLKNAVEFAKKVVSEK